MKVQAEVNRTTVPFESLHMGNVFEFRSELYMKFVMLGVSLPANAVRLDTGEARLFAEGGEGVIPRPDVLLVSDSWLRKNATLVGEVKT